MKRKHLFIISAAMALLLTGCGETDCKCEETECPDNPTPTDPDTPIEEPTKYSIVDNTSDHMSIVGIPTEAEEGEEITFSVACEPGYEFLDAIYVYQGETLIDLKNNGDGTYTFTMPSGSVEIKCDSQISSFGLDFEIDDGLTATAYSKILESSLVKEEYEKVAGKYGATISSGSGWQASENYYEISLTKTGFVTIKKQASEVATTSTYEKEGKYTVSKTTSGETTTYVVKFSFTFDAVNYINGVSGELTFVEAKEEGETNSLVGSLTENSTSSYYGGTYSDKTFAFKGEAASIEEGKYIYQKYDALPNAGKYLDVVYLSVDKTNYLEPDTITLNGEEIAQDESGYYPLSIPYHQSTVKVTSKTRYADITINNGTEVTVDAYSRSENTDSDGNYTYTKITKATYNEQVYLKVNLPEDGSYDLYNIKVEYNKSTYSENNMNISLLDSSSFTKNDDGYYTSSNVKIYDMDLGLIVTVTDISKKYEDTDTTYFGEGKACYPGYSTTYDFSADQYGRIDIKTSSYSTTSFLASESLKETGESDLTRYGYTTSTYHTKTDKEGTYVIWNTSPYSTADTMSDFYVASLNNGETAPTFKWYSDNSSYSSATKTIGVISGAREQNLLIADIDNDNVIDVNFGVTFEVLNGKDAFSDADAIFDVKKDGETLGTYLMSSSGLISSYTKGPEGSYSGTLDEEELTITSTGVTVKLGENSPLSFAFGEENGQSLLHVTRYNSEKGMLLTTFVLNSETNTYEVLKEIVITDLSSDVSVKPSSSGSSTTLKGTQFIGAMVLNQSSTPSKSSYYKLLAFIKEDNTLGFNWESSYYDYEINSNGNLTINGYELLFSEDGASIAATKNNSGSLQTWLFSKDINSYSSSSQSLKYATFNNKYLMEIVPSSTSYGEENQNVYYTDGSEIGDFMKVQTTSTDTKWYDSNTVMTFTNVDTDEVSEGVEYINISSKITYNIFYTYEVSESVTLTISTNGEVTYNGETFDSYEYDSSSKTLTFATALNDENQKVRYTAILDLENKTATVTSTTLTYESSTAYTGTNDASHPWTVDSENGTYTAPSGNNSTTVTYTLTFEKEGIFTFTYTVSSESNYDKFSLVHNETTLLSNISGETTDTYTVEVKAGDTLKFNYYKDSSGARGSDNVVISNISFLALKE